MSFERSDHGAELIEFFHHQYGPLNLILDFNESLEGRPRASTHAICGFPSEVLSMILHYIPISSLGSLAWMNSDCRQWARTKQFASLHLRRDQRSEDICSILLLEGKERIRDEDGRTVKPSLGVCVRYLSVDPGFLSTPAPRTGPQLQQDPQQVLLSLLTTATTIVKIFPNLNRLKWQNVLIDHIPDTISLSASVFSNIRHLTLDVSTTSSYTLQVNHLWALKTLHLKIRRRFYKATDKGTAPLCASILRLCAPTLEELHWENPWHTVIPQATEINGQSLRNIFSHQDVHSLGEGRQEIPNFPRLRILDIIAHRKFKDVSSLEKLLQAPLSVFLVSELLLIHHPNLFKTRGRILTLEILVLYDVRLVRATLEFLRANDHLKKLSLTTLIAKDVLENKILRLLSENFRALTSLELMWSSTSISSSTLSMIGRITSLEQLRLGIGNCDSENPNWPVNHDKLRDTLSPLKRLQRLALLGDTYRNCFQMRSPGSHRNTESYYLDQLPNLRLLYNPVEVCASYPSAETKAIFKSQHSLRMRLEAGKYADIFPSLKWMTFGRLLMAVSRQPGDKPAGIESIDVGVNQEECETLFQHIFSYPHALPLLLDIYHN